LIFLGKWLYKYLLCRNGSIQLEVWIMAVPDLRNTVGARNPFAFAEAKLGKKIDWQNTSADEKRKILERAYGASYHEIFNPSNTSPGFLQPVKSGSGDAKQCDSALIKSLIAKWGPNQYGSDFCLPDGSYGCFDDVVQGALSDCFFMAALSSIAYASMTKTKFFRDLSGSSFDIYFWDNFSIDPSSGVTTPNTSTKVTVTNSHLPLQSNGNLVFGRSNTPAELWPAIYEKSFAEWKSGGTMDEPDYSKLCQGNPVTALANITGYKYATGGTATPTVYDTAPFATAPAAIYDKIAVACNLALPAYPNDRTTKWPVVANTYDSSSLGLSNATIVRNHSYSVLGVQKSGTSRYIVLRNPWGQVPPPVYVDPATLNANRCVLDASGAPVICYGDPNLGTDVLSQNSWMGMSLSDPKDGIFGLNVTAFQKYFQGFGWVYT
jgi:hypothetical protein